VIRLLLEVTDNISEPVEGRNMVTIEN